MSKKLYDTLRVLQWMIPAATALYGVVDKVFHIGVAGEVATLSAAVVGFIGVCLEHESDVYFSTRSIVNKVMPDTEVEE